MLWRQGGHHVAQNSRSSGLPFQSGVLPTKLSGASGNFCPTISAQAALQKKTVATATRTRRKGLFTGPRLSSRLAAWQARGRGEVVEDKRRYGIKIARWVAGLSEDLTREPPVAGEGARAYVAGFS